MERGGGGRSRRRKAAQGLRFWVPASVSSGFASRKEGSSRRGMRVVCLGEGVGSTQPQQPDLFVFVRIVVFSLWSLFSRSFKPL